jgi:thymidylate synthase
MFTLYKEEKYKIFTGKNPCIGVCTSWNEPGRVFSSIEKNVGLLNTLYSKYGINIIFRNLALNPSITKLYLWANGPLSNTEVGKMGQTALKKIWDKGTVKDEDFDLEEGIDIKIVEKIIKNVELVDISDKSLEELIKIIVQQKNKPKPYMKPVKFKEPPKQDYKTFPSEQVGFMIRSNTLAEVWVKIVDTVMRYGQITGTQIGFQQKQVFALNWVIENENIDTLDLSIVEDLPKKLKDIVGLNKKSLEQYHKEVFEKSDENKNMAYTYGNRLQRYKISQHTEFDQIEKTIVEQIRIYPTTRRAAATTMYPLQDYQQKDPPCLSFIQVLKDEDKLHFFAIFRSQDMFKSTFSNTYGLLKLHQSICAKTGHKMGKLHVTTQTAHIYEQDWENAENLAKCLVIESEPTMFWDHTKNTDPRGNFLINIVNNQIELTLQSLKGEELLVLKGKNAKYLSLKITKMGLISKVDHAMDLARELQKAEIALQKNIEYKQDQPLKIKLEKS